MQPYIYVVFSSTPNKMGKMIRMLTGHPYNHVSIALDQGLSQMYSFARRYYRTPFYGGFVHESLSRYHVNGNRATIRICKIPISEENHRMICNRLEQMLSHQDLFLYNHLSILGTPFQRNIRAKAAYNCVQFSVLILSMAGLGINPNEYYSIGDLTDILSPYVIYNGPIPRFDIHDNTYYALRPLRTPILATTRDILKLIPRLRK